MSATVAARATTATGARSWIISDRRTARHDGDALCARTTATPISISAIRSTNTAFGKGSTTDSSRLTECIASSRNGTPPAGGPARTNLTAMAARFPMRNTDEGLRARCRPARAHRGHRAPPHRLPEKDRSLRQDDSVLRRSGARVGNAPGAQQPQFRSRKAIPRLRLPRYGRRRRHRPRPSLPLSGRGDADTGHPHDVAAAHDRSRCADLQEHRAGARGRLDERVQANYRRGTRVRDDYGKLWFNIMDYTGSATRLFADPEFDGEPAFVSEEEIDAAGKKTKETIIDDGKPALKGGLGDPVPTKSHRLSNVVNIISTEVTLRSHRILFTNSTQTESGFGSSNSPTTPPKRCAHFTPRRQSSVRSGLIHPNVRRSSKSSPNVGSASMNSLNGRATRRRPIRLVVPSRVQRAASIPPRARRTPAARAEGLLRAIRTGSEVHP